MTQRHPIQNGRTMFVTTNVANRKPIFLDAGYAREAIDTLYRVQELYPFFLYGFVIMPDHCHFLMHVISPVEISSVVRSYKKAVSHAIGKGPLWQPRFDMRLPENSYAVLQYIHANPVKANLAHEEYLYPWSSASGKWDVTDLPWDM